MSGRLARPPDDAEHFDVKTRLREFRVFVQMHQLKKQDYALIDSARANDNPVRKLASRLLVFGHIRYQQRVYGTKTALTNAISSNISTNKDYARRILAYIGSCSMPRYKRVYTGREVVETARHIGYPLVVKPNNADSGEGVSIGVYDRSKVREAYKYAREFGHSVLVEEFIEGDDCRLLVLNGKFYAGMKRVPAHIVGNNVHTIEQLVTQVNKQISSRK